MSIGMTRLSMGPPSIGPIKEMVLAVELSRSVTRVDAALGAEARRRRHPRPADGVGARQGLPV